MPIERRGCGNVDELCTTLEVLIDGLVIFIFEGQVLHPITLDVGLFRLWKKAENFGERDAERGGEDREAIVVSEGL
jgi:hypothetical protein